MRKEMLVAAGAIFLTGSSVADIVLFDIDADPNAWADAISGKQAKGGWDFDLDPDYGIAGFAGPLTSAGSGPVSPGIITSDNISMSAPDNEGGGNSQVAVGPSAGFGNASNFVGGNYFSDSYVINLTSGDKTALEFTATSLLGSNTVDLSVNGVLLWVVPAPAAGHRWGILATAGDIIHSVDMFDAGGGAQGIQGSGLVYVAIPAPGALALLGFAGLVSHRRRR